MGIRVARVAKTNRPRQRLTRQHGSLGCDRLLHIDIGIVHLGAGMIEVVAQIIFVGAAADPDRIHDQLRASRFDRQRVNNLRCLARRDGAHAPRHHVAIDQRRCSRQHATPHHTNWQCIGDDHPDRIAWPAVAVAQRIGQHAQHIDRFERNVFCNRQINQRTDRCRDRCRIRDTGIGIGDCDRVYQQGAAQDVGWHGQRIGHLAGGPWQQVAQCPMHFAQPYRAAIATGHQGPGGGQHILQGHALCGFVATDGVAQGIGQPRARQHLRIRCRFADHQRMAAVD